ncbi:MAG: hypothetical protein IJ083_15010 [Clostridia bacterium]|nr:hypothetical protein [Clostridia bacterium]
MIPISACFGFAICAILQIAGEADRREEKYFAEYLQKKAEEAPENKEAEA